MFDNLFNKSKKSSSNGTSLDSKVVFHKDVIDIPEHGSLYADHVGQNLKDEPVRFAFVDVAEPPQLEPAVLAHIWSEAERQGYRPKRLRSYATVFALMPQPRTNRPIQGKAQQSSTRAKH